LTSNFCLKFLHPLPPHADMYLLSSLAVPNPHKGFPFVWIVSVNWASPLQKRTAQLWSLNRGPAGSSPVNPVDIPVWVCDYIDNRISRQRKYTICYIGYTIYILYYILYDVMYMLSCTILYTGIYII
jgi:hypothetical protein